jgi:hypothetical protein
VGLEPTTLASQVIGGLRATICFKLDFAMLKDSTENLLRQAARSAEYDNFENQLYYICIFLSQLTDVALGVGELSIFESYHDVFVRRGI